MGWRSVNLLIHTAERCERRKDGVYKGRSHWFDSEFGQCGDAVFKEEDRLELCIEGNAKESSRFQVTFSYVVSRICDIRVRYCMSLLAAPKAGSGLAQSTTVFWLEAAVNFPWPSDSHIQTENGPDRIKQIVCYKKVLTLRAEISCGPSKTHYLKVAAGFVSWKFHHR
jgi:hypothetical protein